MDRAVRVLLDVNVLVGNIMAYDRGHLGTATQTLVSMVSSQTWGGDCRSQLVISLEMMDTLELVLSRLNFTDARIKAYSASIIDIMRYGPDSLDPYLILGGEERFPLADGEDAAVLATAFGARADILVTDNLNDFISKDAFVTDTRLVTTRSGTHRRLQALRYTFGGHDLVIAHPFDVMQWLRLGYDFMPATLWGAIQTAGKTEGLQYQRSPIGTHSMAWKRLPGRRIPHVDA